MLLLKGKYHSLYIKNYFFSVFFFFFPLAIIFQFRTDKEESGTDTNTFVPTHCLSFTLSSFLSFSFVKGVTNSTSSQGLVTIETWQEVHHLLIIMGNFQNKQGFREFNFLFNTLTCIFCKFLTF